MSKVFGNIALAMTGFYDLKFPLGFIEKHSWGKFLVQLVIKDIKLISRHHYKGY